MLKWVRDGLNGRVPLNAFVSYMMFDGQSHSPKSSNNGLKKGAISYDFRKA